MTDDSPDYASPPCYAHEFENAAPLPGVEVGPWRKAQREALIAARMALPVDERTRVAEEVALVLDRLIAPGPGVIVSLYWPFRAELDLRGWMARAQARGARIALPIVEAKAQPLKFREWLPGCKMERGVWNILNPADTDWLTPNVVIAPLVGFDPGCFRLGYGGGFFDRTLAALNPRPMVIGVGHPAAALRTIHPQAHDIPMDVIVTGKDRVMRRVGGSAPA